MQFDRNALFTLSVVIHKVLYFIDTVGNIVIKRSGQLLGILVELCQTGKETGHAHGLNQIGQTQHTFLVGGHLCKKVAPGIRLATQTCAEGVPNCLHNRSIMRQKLWCNHNTLFFQRGRNRHGARAFAANIGMVGTVGDKTSQFALIKNR